LYVTLTTNANLPFSLILSELIALGALDPTAAYAVEVDDPAAASPKLLTVQATLANGTLTFVNASGTGIGLRTAVANHPYVFQFYATPVVAAPSASPSPQATATATPTPVPSAQGAIVANPVALAINGTGPSAAQSLQIAENAYTGSFSESDTCAGIATVVPGTLAGPSATATVTGVASGTCTATFHDRFGQSTPVTITVTVTAFGVQSRARGEIR
jgi:hypothetical protein